MALRFPPRRILVPFDFSPPSLCGLEAAKSLGSLFAARLELVYVREPAPAPLAADLLVAGPPHRGDDDPDLAAMRRRLRECVGEYPSERVHVRTLIGLPPGALARLARPAGADMVVMGTHGYYGFERAMYGSTTEAVVRQARVPVMVVHRRRSRLDLRSILCPVNLTPHSGRALAYAALLAEAVDASLTALYVSPEPEAGRRALRDFVRRTLGEPAERVSCLSAEGEPRDRIARQAQEGPFDLVVLAERVRPWTADRFLGTTAERVLRRAWTPVLAVPAQRAGARA